MLSRSLRRLAKAVLIRRPRRFDVLILGPGYANWDDALLPDSPIWTRLPARRVVREKETVPVLPLLAARRRLIVPLREADILQQPRGGWGLIPSRQAVGILGDKLGFWQHMRRHGLTRLTPETWTRPQDVDFPAVLKRTDMQGGGGVVICADANALTQNLSSRRFRDQPFVVQRYLEGPEFTLHGIAVDGVLAWATAYSHTTLPMTVRVPRTEEQTQTVPVSGVDLADVAAILAPLSYCGPVNVDFKRNVDGVLQVLEVNPRFGGSLFRTQNRADLGDAMQALARHARWLGRQRPAKA